MQMVNNITQTSKFRRSR